MNATKHDVKTTNFGPILSVGAYQNLKGVLNTIRDVQRRYRASVKALRMTPVQMIARTRGLRLRGARAATCGRDRDNGAAVVAGRDADVLFAVAVVAGAVPILQGFSVRVRHALGARKLVGSGAERVKRLQRAS